MFITLTPAYGRDYRSKAAVLTDWNSGKDFIVASIGHPHDGRLINKDDAARTDDAYNVRYDSLRKIATIGGAN